MRFSGVSKSQSPIERLTIDWPVASNRFTSASTASVSVAAILEHPDVAGRLGGGEVEVAGLDDVGGRRSR